MPSTSKPDYDVRVVASPSNPGVPIKIALSPGWSPSLRDACHVARAWHDNGTESTVAVLGYPDDCIEVPEPSFALLLGFGFGLLLGLRWWRGARDAGHEPGGVGTRVPPEV